MRSVRKARRLLLVSSSAAALMLALVVGGSGGALATAGSTVYDSTRVPLPGNVPSQGFQANQTDELGDDIQLAGSERFLTSVTVTMSDWAKHSEWPGVGDGDGYTHPITLNVYRVNTSGANPALGALIKTTTVTQSIPWRPEADAVNCATGSPGHPGADGTQWYDADADVCYNGYAFNITFAFATPLKVPGRIILGIAYNTQTWGSAPIGTGGPYNSLNVGLNNVSGPSVGTDSEPDAVFYNTHTAGNYTDGGAGGTGTFRRDTGWAPYVPMFQVNAIDGCSTDCYVDASTGDDDNTGSAAFPLKTIQAGIDAVQSTGTVHVAGGTYAGAATIDKSLTLQGAQAGVDARGRSASETIIQSTHNDNNAALNIHADDVTIDGVKIVGSGPNGADRRGVNLTSGADRSNIHVINSIFLNLYVGIVRPDFSVDGLTVNQNVFTNDPGNTLLQDAGLWLSGGGDTTSNASITHNGFSNMDNDTGGDFAAINLNGGSDATISGNTSDHDGSFIVMVNFSNVTIGGNSTNHEVGSTIFLGLGNNGITVQNNTLRNGFRGVRLSTAFGTGLSQDIQVLHNTIADMENAGVFVDTGTVSDVVNVHRNGITNSAPIAGYHAVRNTSSHTVDGTCNWWGTNTPAGIAALTSGNVTYAPWLASSNLNGACSMQDISLTPASKNYGSVLVGHHSANTVFTVKNNGADPLTISNVSLTGVNPGHFSINENNCFNQTLSLNQQCTISVWFAPTSQGAKTAQLAVDSNDPDHPSISSDLTGSGAVASNGTITIVLHANPTGHSFTFNGTNGIGTFNLTGAPGSMQAVFTKPAGTYQITQAFSSGWALIGLTCTGGSTTTDQAHHRVLIQLASSDNVTCTFTDSRRRADAQIANAVGGPYHGNNVYSSGPIASQQVHSVVGAGMTRNVYVLLGNDSPDVDSFRVAATWSGAPKYTVTIFRNGVDITTQVKAGTYSVNNLASGANVTIRVQIQGQAGLSPSATGNLDVTLTSKSAPAAKDVVRAHVTAQ
jgi:hypothetical protein